MTPIKEQEIHEAFVESPIGICFVSLDGQFLKVNRALCEFLGYSESELLDLTFQEITHPNDLAKDLRCLDDLYHDKIPYYTIRKRYLANHDGKILLAKLTVYPIKDENRKVRLYLGYIQSISIESMSFFTDTEEMFVETVTSKMSEIIDKKISESDSAIFPKFVLKNWQWFAGALFITCGILISSGIVLYSMNNQVTEIKEEMDQKDLLLLELLRQTNEIRKTNKNGESGAEIIPLDRGS